MSPYILIILAASIAGNAALEWAYLGQRDKITEARGEVTAMEQQRDGARGAASACSDAVDDVRTLLTSAPRKRKRPVPTSPPRPKATTRRLTRSFPRRRPCPATTAAAPRCA